MFKALVLEQREKTVSANIAELEDSRLPEGEVEIAVEYSSLNYKDGLVLNGLGGLVKNYPHVPGIDLAGTVAQSNHPDFQPGDEILSTGWRVGEAHWGGYAQKARLKAAWLVRLPSGLGTRTAMGVGAAGLSAAIALESLEAHGLTPDKGEVLITGAAGGVGAFSVLLLAALGYTITASTGRCERVSTPRVDSANVMLWAMVKAVPMTRMPRGEREILLIELKAGMELARPIFNTNNMKLLDAGKKLEDRHINKVHSINRMTPINPLCLVYC